MGWIKIVFVISVISIQTFALPASKSVHSASRRPGETYREASDRYWDRLQQESPSVWRRGSAEDASVPLEELPLSIVPRVKDVTAVFKSVRDKRYLTSSGEPDFLRRPSWLYPHDGCWIRAGLVRPQVEELAQVAPMKVFIFGSLNVRTKYASGGSVSWWYHVVPVLADQDGEVYAIDPAIEGKQPLKLKDWVLRQVSQVENARVALCSPHTYRPSDECDAPQPGADANATSEIKSYLSYEWNNLRQLGFEPKRLLGELPPWLENTSEPEPVQLVLN